MTDSPKPEPRWEDGVPWCVGYCSYYPFPNRDHECYRMTTAHTCAPTVREMARELREARACIRAMADHGYSMGDAWMKDIAEDFHGPAIEAAMKENPNA